MMKFYLWARENWSDVVNPKIPGATAALFSADFSIVARCESAELQAYLEFAQEIDDGFEELLEGDEALCLQTQKNLERATALCE